MLQFLQVTSTSGSHISKFTLRNQQFSGAEERLLSIVKSSKAVSTNKKYDVYFQKFRGWCIQNNIGYLPASVEAFAVYISGLVQKSVSKSVVLSHFDSIKWFHDFNLLKNPCADKLINLMIEGSKRILGRPIVKKGADYFDSPEEDSGKIRFRC